MAQITKIVLEERVDGWMIRAETSTGWALEYTDRKERDAAEGVAVQWAQQHGFADYTVSLFPYRGIPDVAVDIKGGTEHAEAQESRACIECSEYAKTQCDDCHKPFCFDCNTALNARHGKEGDGTCWTCREKAANAGNWGDVERKGLTEEQIPNALEELGMSLDGWSYE